MRLPSVRSCLFASLFVTMPLNKQLSALAAFRRTLAVGSGPG